MKRIDLFCLVLVLVILVDRSSALLPCSSDAECRRNFCIQNFCRPRSPVGGPCDLNDERDCYGLNSLCIQGICTDLSPVTGPCDDAGDCADSSNVCEGQRCLVPEDESCASNNNNHCVSGLTCIRDICANPSPVTGPCDDAGDCADSSNVCQGQVCTATACPSGNNGDCPSGLTCIQNFCTDPSPVTGPCDDEGDCAVSSNVCQGQRCLVPEGES